MKVSKGTIRERKNSPYLQINLSINGKRYTKQTKFLKDKKEDWKRAKEEFLPVFRAKIISGEISLDKKESSIKTFKYYSELYIKTKVLKPSTTKTYKAFLNRWNSHFGSKDIKTIKPSEIKEVLYNFNVKSSASNQYLIIIRGVFDEAVLDEIIQDNPARKIKAARSQPKTDVVFPFDQDEVNTILDGANGWLKNFLAFAFYTGARTGEIIAMKWQNVDFKKKRIYIDATRGHYEEGTTKTGKARYIPLFDSLVPYLKEQETRTGLHTYVFLTDNGKHTCSQNLGDVYWKPLLKRLRIPYRSIYQTRHTFATTMLNSKKLSMNQLALILGHSTIQMIIKHYNKFLQDELEQINTNINPFEVKKCDTFCDTILQTA
ncbi:MAG: site-specific integrase [Campylobacterota bacterium]|nr:site-specific integrase [Campylobacterota bacterium]